MRLQPPRWGTLGLEALPFSSVLLQLLPLSAIWNGPCCWGSLASCHCWGSLAPPSTS